MLALQSALDRLPPHLAPADLAPAELAPAELAPARPLARAIPAERPAQVPAGAGPVLALRQGQQLFAEGDRAERYYRVTRGTLRTLRLLPDGRRQVVDFHGPGETFGLGSGAIHAFDAEAVTDALLVAYSLPNLASRVEASPALARQLLGTLTRELASAQEQLLLLGRKTARERLASFLLAMARKQGRQDRVELPMKRGDIADHLGLTVETISRLFAALKRERLIALASVTEVVFRDPAALAAIGSCESR
jgi:CRP-like cAMP-binding protein